MRLNLDYFVLLIRFTFEDTRANTLPVIVIQVIPDLILLDVSRELV